MQGISSLRSFWALTTLGRLTDESESGSSDAWATPTAAESHNQDYSAQVYLQNQVQENWPTPKARDWKGESQRGTDAPGDALMNMVNWATPRGEDSQCAGAHHGKPDSLHAQTKATWATPASADCIGATGGGQGRSLRTDTAQSPGQLHPDWVETLQGYPVGWTDVGPPDRAKRSTTGSRRAQGTASPTEPPA
jgi:hypothetical protein